MAISTVKAGLDDIAVSIRNGRAMIQAARDQMDAVIADLNSLPTTYSEVITEINALGVDASDVLYKDELAKLTAEFQDLLTSVNSSLDALTGI